MKSQIKSILLMTSFFVFIAGCQTVPITKPDASVPVEYAAFSGIWEGTWGKSLHGQLAVKKITTDGHAIGIYSWGNRAGSFDAGNTGFKGSINDGVLNLDKFFNDAYVSYRFVDKETLEGTSKLNGRTYHGLFTKQ